MPTTVAVFNQPGLNGPGVGSPSDENSNLLSIIQNEIDNGGDYAINDSIVNFTDVANLQAQLDASSFFFMTDMETANPADSGFLPDAAKTVLRDYVDNGGVIVQTGTFGQDDVVFLNEIFDLNLASASSGSWDKNAANTAGTNFDSGPPDLSNPSATDSIDASAITNGTYTSYYDTGTDANSVVGEIDFGDGTIFFIGFDYFAAGFATDWGEGTHVDGFQNSSPYVTFALPSTLSAARVAAGPAAGPATPVPALADGALLTLVVLLVATAGWFKRRINFAA